MMRILIKNRKLSDSLSPQIKKIQRALSYSGRQRVLQDAAKEFVRMARSSFGSSGQYRGNSWASYSKAYAKKVGQSNPTLHRTGKLKASIRIGNPSANSISVLSRSPYGPAQFAGSKKRHLPPRRFFPMEGQGSNWRLIARADRELTMKIGRDFALLSGGALPKLGGLIQRSKYSVGNPFV